MQLLDEIVTSASGSDEQIAVTLRKCLVLAFKLKNDSLKDWVAHELNGYGNDDPLPNYRKAHGNAKGLFLGPHTSSINEQPIPASFPDKEHRCWASEIELRQPIAAYEGTKLDAKLAIPWPADLSRVLKDSQRIGKMIHSRSLIRELDDGWQISIGSDCGAAGSP